MTPIKLLEQILKPFGLALYVVGTTVGYIWGHLWAGFQDGLLDAYKDTE